VKKEQKQEIVSALHEKFAKAQLVILTETQGLNVATIGALRRKLSEAQVDFKVVKNTLLVRASQDTGVAAIQKSFTGPSAVAVGYGDPVGPAKILSDFAAANDKFSIKTGVMAGRVLSPEAVKALASLPSREVLLSQLLSVFNGVPASLVRALADVPRRMLNVLQAVRDQKAGA
jgi:large subunit ribosomal protein L10